jgi:hypothetical protein
MQRDTVAIESDRRFFGLAFVVLTDAVASKVQRLTELDRDGFERSADLRRRHAHIADAATVEALGEVTKRTVATVADGFDDLAHSFDRTVVGRGTYKRAGEVGTTAEIESGQHAALIVTVTLPPTLPELPEPPIGGEAGVMSWGAARLGDESGI